MIPNGSTPSRIATRRECDMHEIMERLAGDGDLAGAAACREQLAAVSVERSILAAAEHHQARREGAVHRKCCIDCACRRGSPMEPFSDVAEMAADGEPFYCHQGVARDEYGGFEWDATPGAPPPTKVDGSPAELCAGWLAYRRVFLRGEERERRP